MSWKKVVTSLAWVMLAAIIAVFALHELLSNQQSQPKPPLRLSAAANTRTKQANKLLPLDKVLPDLERLLKSPAGKETKAEPPPDLQRSVEWLIWKSRVMDQRKMFERNSPHFSAQEQGDQ